MVSWSGCRHRANGKQLRYLPFSAKRSTPAPLHPWAASDKDWDRVHIDFAEFNKTFYLIMVCSTSKWIEVTKMSSTTAAQTITALKHKFAQFGLPTNVVSDNGPQFASAEFQHFLTVNGIKHTLLPPYHPASNGQAERCVQTIKAALKKQFFSGESTSADWLQSFLLMYRTTPHPTTGRSPAEIFLK